MLPGLAKLDGCRGGYVFRENSAGETELVVISFFDSLEAVERFAGENYTIPVFEPEARALLTHIEPFARHYEVRASPAAMSGI